MTTTRAWRMQLLLAVLVVLSSPAARGPARAAVFSYLYDELGRLIAVVDPAGETAVYRYDLAGNIVSIARHPSTDLVVIDVAPARGPIGTAVTISGTGFSPVPQQNAVSFNGTPATVVSSTATRIVTAVPPGATTGPVKVALGQTSASSATSFTVTSSGGPPVITGFTPAVGAPGTPVTVTGANFEPRAPDNQVSFNQLRRTQVASASTGALDVTVPAVGSGRITVATPAGRAVSAADFFVPPPGYSAADVAVTGRMSSGGTYTATIGAANKIAIVVFEASAGQRLSLRISLTGMSGAQAIVSDPAGSVIQSVLMLPTGYTFNLTLPSSGTHSLAIDPAGAETGSFTVIAGSPDLLPTAFTAPASASVDQTLSVSWTVRNQGTISADTFWTDSVYLSPTPTCCDGATLVGLVNVAPSLPVAGSYTRTETMQVPVAPPGDYYLVLWTDAADRVFEGNEGNNQIARPFTVTAPDLAPTALAFPAAVVPQQSVGVSWTVQNQGTGATFGVWADRLDISPSPVCCAGATTLLTLNVATETPPGGSYTRSATIAIPVLAPGTYYLFLTSDASGARRESSEANNQLALPITVSAPDLVPTALTAPATTYARQSISVSWTVQNQGAGPAVGLWADTLALSPTPTCCAGASVLLQLNVAPGTPPGGSYSQTQTVAIPSLPGGDYYLVVVVDGDNRRFETNEANNQLARPIRVTAPDLTPLALSAPLSGRVGQSIAVSWTVKNDASAPAVGTWTDTVYLSPSPTCCAGAISIGAVSAARTAAAGGTYSATATVPIPTVAAGSYYLIVDVDSANSLAEANETNNERSKKILIFR